MKMQLEHGRPADESDRQERENRVYELLDRLGIDFWRVDHDAARTMEDCAQADRLQIPSRLAVESPGAIK